MKKRNVRKLLMDKLHRGFVWTCIGVTIGGSMLIAWRGFHYFMIEKPRRKELNQEQEAELLREGVHTP